MNDFQSPCLIKKKKNRTLTWKSLTNSLEESHTMHNLKGRIFKSLWVIIQEWLSYKWSMKGRRDTVSASHLPCRTFYGQLCLLHIPNWTLHHTHSPSLENLLQLRLKLPADDSAIFTYVLFGKSNNFPVLLTAALQWGVISNVPDIFKTLICNL